MSWCAEAASLDLDPASDCELLMSTDEIFVFGYECKIFRDDEKADWIDKERHLIPWMGDGHTLIDRYDCRGSLMFRDLQPSDSPTYGLNTENVQDGDQTMETLCEKERYRDLIENCIEFQGNAEEESESNRFPINQNNQYSAIDYVYDENKNDGLSIGPEPKRFDEDLPYSQPPDLFLTPDIILPKTMKSHAIIEKTAKFVAEQGIQMEIFLKAKQSSNSQFDFLDYTDTLNPYYKNLVLMIKEGKYKPLDFVFENEGDDVLNVSQESSDGSQGTSYLHPSLLKKETPQVLSEISDVNYQRTATGNLYSVLVSKIQMTELQGQRNTE